MRNFEPMTTAEFTYPEVGATAPGRSMPTDAHAFRVERVLGVGAERFAQLRTAVLSYRMQTGAGLRVEASAPSAEPGVVLFVKPPLGPAFPCRVVYVLDDLDADREVGGDGGAVSADVGVRARAGFAYGTLPGHPESGEELFLVEHRADDTVVGVVTAFSRPGGLLARLGGPVGRALQGWYAKRYLSALA